MNAIIIAAYQTALNSRNPDDVDIMDLLPAIFAAVPRLRLRTWCRPCARRASGNSAKLSIRRRLLMHAPLSTYRSNEALTLPDGVTEHTGLTFSRPTSKNGERWGSSWRKTKPQLDGTWRLVGLRPAPIRHAPRYSGSNTSTRRQAILQVSNPRESGSIARSVDLPT